MDSSRGMLIARVIRKKNLMDAKVHYGPDDLTVEEAHVLEMIQMEQPTPRFPGMPDA